MAATALARLRRLLRLIELIITPASIKVAVARVVAKSIKRMHPASEMFITLVLYPA
jgi:hypothetical protein